MLGIDFEFCSDKVKDWGLDEAFKDKPYGLKLFCVAVHDGKEARVWWLQDRAQREDFAK